MDRQKMLPSSSECFPTWQSLWSFIFGYLHTQSISHTLPLSEGTQPLESLYKYGIVRQRFWHVDNCI